MTDYAVFNPHGKKVEELPTIFGFNNGQAGPTEDAAIALEKAQRSIASPGDGTGAGLIEAAWVEAHLLDIVRSGKPVWALLKPTYELGSTPVYHTTILFRPTESVK